MNNTVNTTYKPSFTLFLQSPFKLNFDKTYDFTQSIKKNDEEYDVSERRIVPFSYTCSDIPITSEEHNKHNDVFNI